MDGTKVDGKKVMAIVSAALTVISLGVTLAQTIISDKQLDNKIADAVANAIDQQKSV